MADEEIELSGEESQDTAAGKGGTSTMKVVLIAVVGIALVGGAVGATLYLTSEEDEEETKQAQVEEKQDTAKADSREAIYLPLDPPFTVSLDSDEVRKYLQVTMSVMSRDDDVIEAVRRHRPAIRNNLNFLLSSKKYKDLLTREGKEKLREEAMEEIKKTLTENGEESEVEALYFTGLVID